MITETAVSAIFSLFSLMLIVRAIGPEAAGTGSIAVAAFMLADIVAGSLFTDALVQRLDLSDRHSHSAVTTQVAVGIAGSVVLCLIAPGLAAQAEAPAVLPLLMALAALLPFSAYSGATAGLVLRGQRYRLLAFRVLIGQPLALAAGLTAAHAGLGAWAMVAQQVAATLAVFLLLAAFSRTRYRPRFSGRAIADLWPVAGPQIMTIIVLAGRYRLFVLGLGIATTETVVAVCNIAFRLVDSALAVVWGSTARLAMPRFAALQRDRAALVEAYGDIAQLQALLGMPIAAGVALTAPDLVRALLGPAWADAADAAQVVAWVALVSFIYGDSGSLFVALGRTRWNLGLACISLVVPMAALLLARPATPLGVAWCWAGSTVVITPIVGGLVLWELKRSPFWLLGRIAPALAATGTMVLAVLLLRSEITLPPLARLIGAAVVGGVIFATVAWLALGRRLPRALRAVAMLPAE